MSSETKDQQIVLQKFKVLKQSVIDERQKNLTLQTEISSLKEDLEISKELIAKIQHEIKELKDKSAPKQLSKFLNDFFDSPEDDDDSSYHKQLAYKDTQINALTEENNDLKEQISSIQKEKEFIRLKLNEQLSEYDKLKERHCDEIVNMKKDYDSKVCFHNQEIERIESMTAILNKLSRDKNEQTELIEFYEKDIDNKINNIATLYNESEELANEIKELKAEIRILKYENEQSHNLIDTLIPITKKTIFKGYRIININGNYQTTQRHKIALQYTSTNSQENYLFIDENNTHKEIDLNDIEEMIKVDQKTITFTITNSTYVIEFRENLIPYILSYYQESQKRIEDIMEESFLQYSLNND